MKKFLWLALLAVLALPAAAQAQTFSVSPQPPGLAPSQSKIYTSTNFYMPTSGTQIWAIEVYDEIFAGDYEGGASIWGIYTQANPAWYCRLLPSLNYYLAVPGDNLCSNGINSNMNYLAFFQQSGYVTINFTFPCVLSGDHWWGHRTGYRVYWNTTGWGPWYKSVDSGGTYGSAC